MYLGARRLVGVGDPLVVSMLFKSIRALVDRNSLKKAPRPGLFHPRLY
jgi:hypothetical protein